MRISLSWKKLPKIAKILGISHLIFSCVWYGILGVFSILGIPIRSNTWLSFLLSLMTGLLTFLDFLIISLPLYVITIVIGGVPSVFIEGVAIIILGTIMWFLIGIFLHKMHLRKKEAVISSLPEIREIKAKKFARIIYILYAAALVEGITYFVAIIMNYVTRIKASGTWVEGHYNWQIKTFWISLIIGVIGLVMISMRIKFGGIVLIGLLVWYIYRMVKGGWYLSKNRSI